MKADQWLPFDAGGGKDAWEGGRMSGLRSLLEVIDKFMILFVVMVSQCMQMSTLTKLHTL